MMVECNADQLEERRIIAALEAGHKAMLPLVEVQAKMRAELGKPKREYITIAPGAEVEKAVLTWGAERLAGLTAATYGKSESYDAMRGL